MHTPASPSHGPPESIAWDPLWSLVVYRLAVQAADDSWADVTCLARDRRTAAVATQLGRAVGSIGANIAEGYSRGTGPDRARFLEYALGSAREARHWYYQARHVIGTDAALARTGQLAEIVRILLVLLPRERSRKRHADIRR